MKKFWMAALLGLLMFPACSDDDDKETAAPPVINLDSESARYKVKAGKDLLIEPTYENVDAHTTYVWKQDQKIVGREATYKFNEEGTGDYFVKLQVINNYGMSEEELKVTVLSLDAPMIALYVPEEGYKVIQEQELKLTPVVDNESTSQFEWTVNGTVVGTEKDYTFKQSQTGTYTVRLRAYNNDGEDSEEFAVVVCEPSEMPFSWKFPQTTFNLSQGRRVKVKAYLVENDFGATYTWMLNGKVVEEGDKTEYVFDSEALQCEKGTYTLSLTMKNEFGEKSQNFTINVCDPEGTYYRKSTTGSMPMVNKVYEYMPAPGHQVNGYSFGAAFPDNYTMAQACAHVLETWGKMWNISLGSCCGYVIAGFDHSVDNSNGDWDLLIKGNPYGYQSEPGIIWVSQDENGNGLPDDTWYELAGSEYGTENSTYEYAITYYKPTKNNAAIKWTDNQGKSGAVPYLAEWNSKPSYWQDWVPVDEKNSHTYYGTQLKDRSSFSDGMSTVPPYDWGYTDNESSIDYIYSAKVDMSIGHFKLSNAKTFDHKDANLKYIDFIKIQTGQIGATPNLGDISTEVHYISDYHLDDISYHPEKN